MGSFNPLRAGLATNPRDESGRWTLRPAVHKQCPDQSVFCGRSAQQALCCTPVHKCLLRSRSSLVRQLYSKPSFSNLPKSLVNCEKHVT